MELLVVHIGEHRKRKLGAFEGSFHSGEQTNLSTHESGKEGQHPCPGKPGTAQLLYAPIRPPGLGLGAAVEGFGAVALDAEEVLMSVMSVPIPRDITETLLLIEVHRKPRPNQRARPR